MPTIVTDLANLRESARRIRAEVTGAVTSTNVQNALEASAAAAAGAVRFDISQSLNASQATRALANLAANTLATFPLVTGGATAGSTLTLQSTSGAGTSDLITFKVASQSEAARIDTSKHLTLGGGPNRAALNAANASLQVNADNSTSYFDPNVQVIQWSGGGGGPRFWGGLCKSGTIGTQTGGAVALNDNVLQIKGWGSDGTAFAGVAAIDMAADAAVTPGSGIVPGRIDFSTANSSGVVTIALRIDSAGNVITGGVAAQTMAFAAIPRVQLHGTDGPSSELSLCRWQSGGIVVGSTLALCKSGNATIGSHTIVGNGEQPGVIDFAGDDGVAFQSCARINAAIDGVPGANNMPGRLEFRTQAANAGNGVTPGVRLTIDSTGLSTFTGNVVAPAAITPIVIGGATASSTLILESTSGVGTTDAIIFKTASQIEALRIDTSQNLSTGGAGNVAGLFGNVPKIGLNSTDGQQTLALNHWGTTDNANAIYFTKGKSGTIGSHSSGTMGSNQPIASLEFGADDGSAFREAAFISVNADGAVSAGSSPGRMLFATTPSGAVSAVQRLKIDSNGQSTFLSGSGATSTLIINPSAASAVQGLLVSQTGPTTGYLVGGSVAAVNRGQATLAYNSIQVNSEQAGVFLLLPAVSGAVSGTAGVVRLTVSTAGITTGDVVTVSGVVGTTEANGVWSVTVVDGTHLELVGSTFAHAYVSGGTVGAGLGFTTALQVGMETGGGNSAGSKIGINVNVDHTSASAPGPVRDHVAIEAVTTCTASDGGFNTGAGAKGTCFAYGGGALLLSGASDFLEVCGCELEIGIATGASAANRIGWQIVDVGDLQAAGTDCAYDIKLGVGSAPGFKVGYNISNKGVGSAGTILGTDGTSFTIAKGVDFSTLTISGNFLTGPSSNFTVAGGTGNVFTSGQVNANSTIHAFAGTATPAGGTAGVGIALGSTSNLGIFFGSGAPSLSAAQGSLYLRSDGAQNARLYINTNSSNGWATFNTLT